MIISKFSAILVQFWALNILIIMKSYHYLAIISLLSFSINAQTTLTYTGNSTYNFYGRGIRAGGIGEALTNSPSASHYNAGLLGNASNSNTLNIGILGTTQLNRSGNPSSYIGVLGDNSIQNYQVNAQVYGGKFIAANSSINGHSTGVEALAYSITNGTLTTGMGALAANTNNTNSRTVIGVKGFSQSGSSTINNSYDVSNPGGYFESSDGQGIYATTTGGFNLVNSNNKTSQAITGYSNDNSSVNNIGVIGIAGSSSALAQRTYGVVGQMTGFIPASVTNAAIYGVDDFNISNSYAGYFSGKMYVSQKVGIGILTPNNLLEVNGRARIRHNAETSGIWFNRADNVIDAANGSFYGMKQDTETGIFIGGNWMFWVNNAGNATLIGTLTQTSDKRLKKDFSALSNSLSSLNKINGYHYYWKEESRSHDLQTGVIAQEVEKVFPELVNRDEKGFLSVNYIGLVPHLIEAVKELLIKNEELKIKSEKLEAKVSEMQNLKNRLEKLEALLLKTDVEKVAGQK